jgi:hypothetical protein
MWINHFEVEPYGARGMYFYEPLKTKAPRAGMQPYCCLIRTVIFYAVPFHTRKDGTTLVDYGQCETEWDLLGERFMEGDWLNGVAALVIHEGQIYELATGRVMWRKGGWQMKHLAWRVTPNDARYPFIIKKMQEVMG